METPDILSLAAPYPYVGMQRDNADVKNIFFQSLVDWYHNAKREPVWDGKIWYPMGHDCRPQEHLWDGKLWYPLPFNNRNKC